ncbi:MAG: hypothetical protein PF694_03250 [Bacteroidetes bacterium]|jgi:hypothetical protein|nr:hypothetical protein [Bacteroidota bacterium]
MEKQATHRKHLSLGQLMAGSFSLMYYLLSVILATAALVFNRFLIDWETFVTPYRLFNEQALMLMLITGLVINLGAVVGLIIFLAGNIKGLRLFLISAVLLLFVQTFFGGFEGWQKFVVEIFLIMLLIALPYKTRKTNENKERAAD